MAASCVHNRKTHIKTSYDHMFLILLKIQYHGNISQFKVFYLCFVLIDGFEVLISWNSWNPLFLTFLRVQVLWGVRCGTLHFLLPRLKIEKVVARLLGLEPILS